MLTAETTWRKRCIFWLITAFALGTIVILAAGCSADKEQDRIAARVLSIIDGDTIKVRTTNGEDTVRLLLVDSPETNRNPAQPFGLEAAQFAEERLKGKAVWLELDGPERDRYDRLLAYVWADGENFNQLLLQEGLARLAYVYDPPYKHYDAMLQAERKARKARKGIWSIPDYVHDRGFDSDAAAAAGWHSVERSRSDGGQAGKAAADDAKVQKSDREQTAWISDACPNPAIKGNINSRGEKIYHVPGGRYYEQTKPEALFCTEEEAVHAGFRAPKQ